MACFEMDRSNWKFKFSSSAQVVTGDFTSWFGRVRLLCTHIKNLRAERAKLLFSFVKYANFWCHVLFNKNSVLPVSLFILTLV